MGLQSPGSGNIVDGEVNPAPITSVWQIKAVSIGVESSMLWNKFEMLQSYASGFSIDEHSARDWLGHATMQKAGARECPKPYLSSQF
ncbi:MAG: hypothetical protein CL912_31105 [Deltaproteobacteria bacterium]|nr:hypothetical protein [Deltaproteobacteria bacterium]